WTDGGRALVQRRRAGRRWRPGHGAGRRFPPSAGQRLERTRRCAARHDLDPAGAEGRRRDPGRNRSDVMTGTVTPTTPAPIPTSRAATPPAPEGTPEMRHIAEQFESMFLSEMLAPMFEGIKTDGLGGGGIGEEVFRPMLIEKYAEALSH